MTARILLGPGINAVMKRANASKMKLDYCYSRAPIINVELENIKSAACDGFTEFQSKLLLHLDYM